MSRRRHETDATEQVALLNQQAVQAFQQQRFQEAIDLATRACDLARQTLGEHHLLRTSLQNLALMHEMTGNYQAAEPLYQQALDGWRKAGGGQSPSFALVLNNLGVLHSRMGNDKDAE